MQNDFVLSGAAAEIPGTQDIVPNALRLLRAARRAPIPVVHIVRLYRADGSDADLCRRSAIEQGACIVRPHTPGADIVPELKPNGELLDYDGLLAGRMQSLSAREWALYKPRWGAFYRTELESFLRREQVDTLIFMGCNFPNCPRASIYEASERDFKIVLAVDALSQTSFKGLEEMERIGVNLLTAAEIIRLLA